MTSLMKELRERVQVQRAAHGAGSGGGFEETYDTLATVWAKIEDSTGKRPIGSVQTGTGGTARIRVRYSDIFEKDLYILQLQNTREDRRYRILSLRNVDYEYLDIEAEEVNEE